MHEEKMEPQSHLLNQGRLDAANLDLSGDRQALSLPRVTHQHQKEGLWGRWVSIGWRNPCTHRLFPRSSGLPSQYIHTARTPLAFQVDRV